MIIISAQRTRKVARPRGSFPGTRVVYLPRMIATPLPGDSGFDNSGPLFGYSLEHHHDNRALSKPRDWQRGSGQNPRLDPGQRGPENSGRRTIDGRRLMPERGL